MLIIDSATEFSNPQDVNLCKAIFRGNIPSKIFVKEHHLEVINCGYVIHFFELDSSIFYSFQHRYSGDIVGIVNVLFKIKDIDLALYLIFHTYHRAICNKQDGLSSVLQHPQYSHFVNTNEFHLQIDPRYERKWFSPFVEEKPQNLNTKITPKKLVKAILAGQIEKVICNGNHTDNWGLDQDSNFWKGEWDPLDLAENLFNFPSLYVVYKKDDGTLSVGNSAGEWSESYTVYLK